MSKYKMTRWTDDMDPSDRCQRTRADNTQCKLVVVPGSRFCPGCGGNKAAGSQKRRYHLTKWRERQQELADDMRVTQLNDEIGILRMMLEAKLNTTGETLDDLAMMAGPIGDLALKICRLAEAHDRMVSKSSDMLSKARAQGLANELLQHCCSILEALVIRWNPPDPDAIMEDATTRLANLFLETLDAETPPASS